jgi:hypothetical protein
MQDDSGLNSGSAKRSKGVNRAQTFMTDSFRMASSVIGPNAARKAQTINVPSTFPPT